MLRKKSLRIRYIVSVLTIMIPILVFSLVIYTYNGNNNRRHVENTITNNFSRAISSIDALFDNMDALIEKHFSLRSSWLKDDENANLYIAQSLARIQSELDSRVEVFCYERGSNDISMPNQTVHYEEFDQLFHNGYNLSAFQFFTKLLKITSPTFLRVPSQSPEANENMLVYMYPVSLPDSQEVFVFTFMIKETLIASTIHEYMGEAQGDIYIYMSADNSMAYKAHADNTILMPLQDVYKFKGVGFFPQQPNELGIIRDLSNRGLTYVMVARQAQIYAAYSRDSDVLGLLIAVLLISCFGLAVAVALFNYHPIRDLAQEIVGENMLGQDGNELYIIKKHFMHTEEEKEALALRLSSQNTVMLGQLCIKLASGNVSGMAELEYLLHCASFSFEYPYSFALSIQLPLGQADAIDTLMDLCSGFYAPQAHTMSGELFRENTVCMIVNCFATPEGQADRRRQIAGDILAFLQGKAADVIIGVGNVYQNPLMLHDSYLEAASITMHARGAFSQRVLFYNDMLDNDRSADVVGMIPQGSKSLLIESIRQGDQAIAQRALTEVFAWLEHEPNSALLLRLHCVNLVNAILESVRAFNISIDSRQLTALMALDMSEALFHNIRDMVTELCAQVMDKLQISDIQKKKQLLDFIAEHYTQPDFSLQLVMDSLHIGKNRINAILKEDVNMGFAQYVSWLRMTRFRLLLLTTNRSIQDLVAEVGYMDVSSFLRKFKNIEGVTAGQFRAQHMDLVAPDSIPPPDGHM